MRQWLPMLVLVPVTFSATPNLAQTKTEAELDEEIVVVTARKREENLTDTPLAVTALSGAALTRYQVDDLGGLRDIVPNLSVNIGDAANAIVYVRGVGQRDSLSFADPGVGIYLDDVYLGRAQGAFLEVIDIERIEVLRGPQGTLYGRNTIGGAIKYVSAQPSPERTFLIEAGLGDYAERSARVVVNGPIGDGTAALGRLSVAYASHEGYRQNTLREAGPTDGDKNLFAWRGQLDLAPSARLSLKVTLDGSKSAPQRSLTPVRVTPGPSLVAATANKGAAASPLRVEADFNDIEDLHVRGAGIRVDYTLANGVTLKSTTAYREVDHQTHIDLDGTGYEIFGVFVDQDQDQFSQEIQLSVSSGKKLRGLVGAYWFSENDVTPDGIRNTEPIDFALGGGFFLPYNTVSENDQSIDARAVFGEFSWKLNTDMELTAGLRYTDESRQLRRKACQAFSMDQLDIDRCNPPAGSLNPFALRVDLEESFDATTPKIGFSYDGDFGLLYANWARGFKSGGFDGRIGYNGASDSGAVEAQTQAYEPEFATTFEVGWKGGAVGSWQLAVAAFFNDYTDLQLSSFSATPGGGFATVFTNAGKAETVGFEVELLTRPAKNLLVEFNLGHLDAQYKEFIDAAGGDVSDERTPINAPDWTVSLGIQSRHETGFGRLRLAADLGYRSKYYVDVNNLDALAQDGYRVVNASIDLEAIDERWGVSFGVKNLTDAEYITHGFDLTAFPGVGLAYYGDPRTYRLRMRYRFQ